MALLLMFVDASWLRLCITPLSLLVLAHVMKR
jgi:hypothetical protein